MICLHSLLLFVFVFFLFLDFFEGYDQIIFIVKERLILSVWCKKWLLTVLNERMANKFAIIVENPGAKQLCAIKPNFNSAKQITSSPCFQSHEGIFNKYA